MARIDSQSESIPTIPHIPVRNQAPDKTPRALLSRMARIAILDIIREDPRLHGNVSDKNWEELTHFVSQFLCIPCRSVQNQAPGKTLRLGIAGIAKNGRKSILSHSWYPETESSAGQDPPSGNVRSGEGNDILRTSFPCSESTFPSASTYSRVRFLAEPPGMVRMAILAVLIDLDHTPSLE